MKYNLTVIGAGPGGYMAAIKAAQLGLKVALIEKDHVGGTCLNRGCISTKALLYSANLYREAKAFSDIGINIKELAFDFNKMHEYKNATVLKVRDGVEFLLKANNIHIYNGMAVLMAEDRVKVTGKADCEIFTDKILIATGSVPVLPDVNGIESNCVLTSDQILEGSHNFPKHITIIGGGVIGVEFATIYNALDAEVAIIEIADSLIPSIDKEISRHLTMMLKRQGVKLNLKSFVTRIEKGDKLKCYFKHKAKEHCIETDMILTAIGRRPNTDGLGLAQLGVYTENGKILVNEKFATNIPNIYAIGDVLGGVQLAHLASAQAIYAVEAITGVQSSIDLNTISNCIYTTPEIATVGMSTEDAERAGIEIITGRFPMSANGKAMIEKQEIGFVKVICEKETGRLIGAAMLCPRATDMIGELSLAIANEMTIDKIANLIHPHPTFSEAVFEAAENVYGVSVHLLPQK
jgi:dihydrolipoamide dehydrogenase